MEQSSHAVSMASNTRQAPAIDAIAAGRNRLDIHRRVKNGDGRGWDRSPASCIWAYRGSMAASSVARGAML
jgi:hypothetical protein